MSGVAEASLRESQIAEEPALSGIEITPSSPAHGVSLVYDEQIRLLLQQLFFHPERPQYRHVAFAAVDLQSDITPLCLNVAWALSDQGKYEVGLIDAGLDCSLLNVENEKTEGLGHNVSEVEKRLWIVRRQEWIHGNPSKTISDENLARLSELTRQFDFSIQCCGAMSWLATKVGRLCDGLVLVLTANQTRRLVAQKILRQLRAAQIPVLGTVLAERRFPVPGALYRKL